ncbi:MAG: hypothetical protein JO108_26450 [Acidobacteriaceae bacterium]|nr:hypothetical protein [Acidobacteriaceae bacterium]
MFLAFLPVCLGIQKRMAHAPKPSEWFLLGTSRISTANFCEQASYNNEIVAVVPLKAEGAPVPGAGISPEAVPGNSAETKNTRTISHLFGNRSLTRFLRMELMDSPTGRCI